MKTKNKYLVFSLTMAAMIGIVTTSCDKSDSQKVGSDLKTTAQDTASAAKDVFNASKDTAVVLATNTVAAVKIGAQKAGDVATNVAASVKTVSSNVWQDAKSVTTNVIDKANGLIH